MNVDKVMRTGVYSKAGFQLLRKAVEDEMTQKRAGMFMGQWIPLCMIDRKQYNQFTWMKIHGIAINGINDCHVCLQLDGEVVVRLYLDRCVKDAQVPTMQRLRNAVKRLTDHKHIEHLPEELLYSSLDIDEGCQLLYDYLKCPGDLQQLKSGKRKYSDEAIAAWIGKPLDPFKQQVLGLKLAELQKLYDEVADGPIARTPRRMLTSAQICGFVCGLSRKVHEVVSLLS